MLTSVDRITARRLGVAALACMALFSSACDRTSIPGPTVEPTLDLQLRQSIGNWGVVPILPPASQNPQLVSLGRSLFSEKMLSGNRDIACSTCHDERLSLTDRLSLPIGTGAVASGAARTLGTGRQFVPRNAPTLLNVGLGFFYMFWDGRLTEFGFGGPPGGPSAPPADGVDRLLVKQAMLPVIDRVEMRGQLGDVDVSGAANELAQIADVDSAAVWRAVMKRLMNVQDYVAKFGAAYPGVPASSLTFEHAARALAAFEIAEFTRTNTPFDRFLKRDASAMSDDAKRGGLLFFGRARCSTCHNGPLLGGQRFASVAAPQLGPGRGDAMPLDNGHFPGQINPQTRFFFRVPPLRNVELTAPYMHNGAYATLEAVVKHYNNVPKALREYDVMQLAPALRASYHGDAATINSLLESLDFMLRTPLELSDAEQKQLIEFLRALTDPSAR